MTDRPILMSAPMVKALLREIERPGSGKTQTRRLAWREFDPEARPGLLSTFYQIDGRRYLKPTLWQSVTPGDGIYVRETWQRADDGDDQPPIYFKATDAGNGSPWKPSIHMPRKASRIALLVTAVKTERVRAISEEDARLEGIGAPYLGDQDPPFECDAVMVSRRMQYRNLWRKLHTKPGARWEDNPEVVALQFTPKLCNIDAMEPQR